MISKNKLLSDLYFNTKNKTSFGSINNLFKSAKIINKNITLNYVKKWISKQETYSQFKKVVKKYKRNQIIIKSIDDIWFTDLIDMREYAKSNKNIKFLLTVIDGLSKFAWCIPLINK